MFPPLLPLLLLAFTKIVLQSIFYQFSIMFSRLKDSYRISIVMYQSSSSKGVQLYVYIICYYLTVIIYMYFCRYSRTLHVL